MPESVSSSDTHGWRVGQRVKLHPATDWWMRGARYGTIERVGRKLVHVRLEVGGAPINRVARFTLATDLIEVIT